VKINLTLRTVVTFITATIWPGKYQYKKLMLRN